MKAKAIALAGIAAPLFVAGTASAAFTGVTFTSEANFNSSGLTRYNLYANFTASTDLVTTMGGAFGQFGLDFLTDDPLGLNNNGNAYDGTFGFNSLQTYSNMYTNVFDSAIGIGFSGSGFTPGFLTEIGGGVGGTAFSTDDGGVFAPVAVAAGAGNSGGSSSQVQIARFVLTDGTGFSFNAGVGWNDGVMGGDAGLSQFAVGNLIPAPGAVALLGLAGLAGRGRRRRTA